MANASKKFPDRQEHDRKSTSEPTDRTLRVLLVEDCWDQLRLLECILTNAGAKVTVEANGQSAFDRIISGHGDPIPFDVIVTDVQMPVLDGIEMTRKLRKAGYTIPIVSHSSDDDPSLQRRALKAGCDFFVRKSRAYKDLLTHLQQYARYGTSPDCSSTESTELYRGTNQADDPYRGQRNR